MTLRRSTFLWLLAVAGCDAGDSASTPTADAGATTDAGPMADAGVDPNACQGRYVITAIEHEAPCAAHAVQVGDRVVVAGGRAQVGPLDLAVTAASMDCVVEASACAVDLEAGDRSHTTARLDAEAARLSLSTEQAAGFAPVACPPAQLTLAPVAGDCLLDGAYTIPAPLTLASGQCDLSWPEEPVFVDTRSETPTVRVGRSTFDITAIDPEACTLEAHAGLAIYNDVPRTTRVHLSQGADGAIQIAVHDALDGMSSIGQTCVDARFEGALAPAVGEPQLAQCEALPFVCGDGTCAEDAGENCGNCEADCGCVGGSCTELRIGDDRAFACTTSCTAEACAPEQRCVPAEEFDAFFHTGRPSTRICVPALDDNVGLGGDCDDSRRCASGLMCARNIRPDGRCLPPCDTVDRDTCRECWPITADPNDPIELCRPRCGPGVESACGDSACASREASGMCSQEGDHGFCQPLELAYECRPEGPGYGEACAPGGWCGGVGLDPQTGSPTALGCVSEGCERVDGETICDETVCSQPCEVDADCPAPLGRCSIIETPRGPSKWCRAPR